MDLATYLRIRCATPDAARPIIGTVTKVLIDRDDAVTIRRGRCVHTRAAGE